MIVTVPIIGKNGILKDVGIGDLPPDTFTDAENVRFRDGQAELMRGDTVRVTSTGDQNVDEEAFTTGIASWTLGGTGTMTWAEPNEQLSDIDEGDPHYTSVVSLLRLDDAQGATNTTDDKGVGWTFQNGAAVDKVTARYSGTGSIELDDTGPDYLEAEGVSTDFWNFLHDGTVDYTVEFSVRQEQLGAGNDTILDTGGAAGTGLTVALEDDDDGSVIVGPSIESFSSGTLADSTWADVALSYSTTYGFRYFVDGTLEHSDVVMVSPSTSDATNTMKLGYRGSEPFNGRIAQVRITKGVARYLSDYTPDEMPNFTGDGVAPDWDGALTLTTSNGTVISADQTFAITPGASVRVDVEVLDIIGSDGAYFTILDSVGTTIYTSSTITSPATLTSNLTNIESPGDTIEVKLFAHTTGATTNRVAFSNVSVSVSGLVDYIENGTFNGNLDGWTEVGTGTFAYVDESGTDVAKITTSEGNGTSTPGLRQKTSFWSGRLGGPFIWSVNIFAVSNVTGYTIKIGTTAGNNDLYDSGTLTATGETTGSVTTTGTFIWIEIEALDSGNAAGFIEIQEVSVEFNDFAPLQLFYVRAVDSSGNANIAYKSFLSMSRTKGSVWASGFGGLVDVSPAAGFNQRQLPQDQFKQWTGTSLSQFIIVTNWQEAPHVYDASDRHAVMTSLANWPDTNLACRSIKSHRQHLIAMGLRDFQNDPGGVSALTLNYPHRIRWSHPAVPGALPVTWDIADVTKDAGEWDLPGSDWLLDGGSLKDLFVLYKEETTHLMQYVGGVSIWRFTQAFTQAGILNNNCFVELEGQHVVLTGTDLIIHDGVQANSLVNGTMRRWLFDTMDVDNADLCFLVRQPFFKEIWVCFPTGSSGYCDKALVWNYKQNTFSVRDLPGIAGAALGPLYVNTTDEDDYWEDSDRVMVTVPGKAAIAQADSTTTDVDSAAIVGLLEHKGMTFGKPDIRKYVRGVRPRFKGAAEAVDISIGYHDDLHTSPTYGTAQTFTIGTDFKSDFDAEGRYIAIKFDSTAAAWQLESIDFDIEYTGEY